MFAALLHDVVKEDRFEAVALVDEAWADEPPSGVRLHRVIPGNEMDALLEQAARVDATLLVAPESGGILGRRVAAVRNRGGRPLAASAGFIEVASDKQATVAALAAAGVPVPAGRSLEAGDGWPRGFRLPAVRKARASVGCDGLVVVGEGRDPPRPADGPTRLEAFSDGTPVGVSCLCGPGVVWPLPPMRQLFTGGESPRFTGGMPLADVGMRDRAERLARRSIAAVARAAAGAVGWVGVDMIIGTRDDGRGDRVLEVNPRLTTSFVGYERSCATSLVRAMLVAAGGHPPALSFDATRGEFSVADHGSHRSNPVRRAGPVARAGV